MATEALSAQLAAPRMVEVYSAGDVGSGSDVLLVRQDRSSSMTHFYTEPCAFCDGPIKMGKATPWGPNTDWHHEDLSICRENIRADERAKALVRHLAKMEEFDEALAAARADEHKRVMDFCCEDTEADIRKRLAKEVAEIYIPALDNYGAVSAAAWMRLAASSLVGGETPSK